MEYTIYIKNETELTKDSPVADVGAQEQPKNTDAEKVKKTITGMVAYKAVKSFASQIVSYEINQVDLNTGNKELQERHRFAYKTAQTVFNIAESVAIGAAVGNLPGAIFGLVTSTASTLIGMAQNQETLNKKNNLEQISISFANQRAGFTGSRR